MTTKQTFGTETGCVFDSRDGIWIYESICDLARVYGWDGTWSQEDNENGNIVDISDEAMEWLDLNVAEDGYRFGWWEGNFMYWSDEEWEEAYAF